ncbi:hypothetical protein FPV67DRAFT_1453385 [Lyophyllum atratum]|nr:hypothetical protein FPV67DRAFT_1453385 [Lyophyllum atratum]
MFSIEQPLLSDVLIFKYPAYSHSGLSSPIEASGMYYDKGWYIPRSLLVIGKLALQKNAVPKARSKVPRQVTGEDSVRSPRLQRMERDEDKILQNPFKSEPSDVLINKPNIRCNTRRPPQFAPETPETGFPTSIVSAERHLCVVLGFGWSDGSRLRSYLHRNDAAHLNVSPSFPRTSEPTPNAPPTPQPLPVSIPPASQQHSTKLRPGNASFSAADSRDERILHISSRAFGEATWVTLHLRMKKTVKEWGMEDDEGKTMLYQYE